MSNHNLPHLRDSAKLPVSTLDHSAMPDDITSRWQRRRKPLILFASLLTCIALGAWLAMNTMRPYAHNIDIDIISQQLRASTQHDTPESTASNQAAHNNIPNVPADTNSNTGSTKATSTASKNTNDIPVWRPDSEWLYWNPQDSPNIETTIVRVFVVTIQARVTAYTAYDHATTHPEWADGIVAWHPRRRKRRVVNHPYCLATDWTQFPGGATFIRVPGYMPKSFPKFPEAFRVVDDKCGRARLDKRKGLEPVIDVRYLTLHSAISGRGAWGMKHLNVEVIFPANFTIPASLQPYVVSAEWRTYENGDVIDSQIIPFR